MNKLQEYKPIILKICKYLFDFIIVFTGVFLAFWLSEHKDNREKEDKKREIYIAIYEDLNSFYESGKRENKKGFVNFFESLDRRSDSLISSRKIPVKTTLYGDYWKIPIINSFVQNGFLRDIDVSTFKKITRFNTVHQNLLENIKDYNIFYDKYVTADYDKGMEHFYKEGTNKLKPKYSYLENALAETAAFADLLVNLAHELSMEIKEKHIDKEK